MPRAFKSLGYQVHGIGKWHLGYVNDTCAPWGRGFDSYIGYMNGNEGYFQHGISSGKDWHLCTDTANASACDVCSPKYDGRYSTHVYAERAVGLVQKWRRGDPPLFVYLAWQAVHEPMEAPPEYIKPFEAIEDRSRRVYAAMLLALDEGIGNLTMALGASLLVTTAYSSSRMTMVECPDRMVWAAVNAAPLAAASIILTGVGRTRIGRAASAGLA